MFQYGFQGEGPRRRGAVIVLTVVVLAVLCGLAAMTLDVGYLYNVRADLQRTADAAALAAAARLAEHDAADPVARAREAAMEYVKKNPSLGKELTIEENDITFGLANYDVESNSFNFEETEVLPDAVRVRVRRAQGSPNGVVTLWFARLFGIHATNVSAQATAVMTPRDIAITVDLSGSINDDSELKSYKLTEINLFDVWNALPGGSDDVSACDDIVCGDGQTCADGVCVPRGPGAQSGPAWGYFDRLGFGTTDLGSSYNPATDPGLIRLAYNANWNHASLSAYLSERGYSADEVAAIMSAAGDSGGAYPYRVAVALGLADWKSGRADGLWSLASVVASAADGDTLVESNELEWKEAIFGNSLSVSRSIWVDYINSYMRSTSTGMYKANSNFRYAFGIKTIVNYFLESRESHAETPELAATPAQPMQAIKDAGMYMVKLLDELQTNDQLSLEVYATTARHEMNLTTNFTAVAKRLSEAQAGHYDSSTNIGGGIQRAIDELTSSRARTVSRKVIVLLTDGIANVDENGKTGTTSGGAAYALAQAQKAADLGIKVFAVSVGSGADRNLMTQIASIGNGEHFHAEGSIEEYSADLARIFSTIGVRRSVTLIE